ncbi:MAG: PrgI family protein [Patescibacteria group bacterium]|nr:PrgI family protein [Patescibacteria group bacterium]
MKFQVPQFIEIEDKIFGPLTLKQFIYLAGGAGLSYIIYAILYIYIALPIIAIVIGFSLALAFYKINSKPFISIVESAVKYALGNKLYIWKKEDRKIVHKKDEASQPSVFIPKLSDSKLKDLTWSLDINEVSTPGVKEMYNESKKNKV